VRIPVVLGLAAVLTMSACGGTSTDSAPGPSAADPLAPCGATLQELTASASAEGALTLIATPDDWANYSSIIDGFEADYGISVEVVLPFASSAEELDIVSTSAGETGRPDVIDIGPSFIQQALDQDLVTAYQPTTWSQIPESLKDPDGRWIGSYYGLLTIGANLALVDEIPTTWSDLVDPRYKGQVVLNGDPRQSGTGFAAVVAAALANGGSYADITPGINYFATLAQSGNLRVETITPEAVASGDVPIMLDWAYNLITARGTLQEQGGALAIHVPRDGIFGSYYAQAITKDPEHPCAARLWMEHLLGDSAAIARLNGLAIPARFASIDAYGLIPPATKEVLPSSKDIYALQFPTGDELASMNDQLDEQWETKVARVLD
jgi:putative spermidine/putrescine transport system substrate-binding protein